MAIEVRTVREDELAAYLDTMTTAFLERLADPARIADELRETWDLTRTWAGIDDGRPCGTFRSWATELTVPGGDQVTAAAVSGVTVRVADEPWCSTFF